MNGKPKISNILLSNAKLLFLGILASACVSKPSYSQTVSPSGLYYYEGNQRVSLELEPNLVAEFGFQADGQGRTVRSTVQKVDTGARLQSSHGFVGLWKTESGKIDPSSLSKSLSPSQSNQFSPVFKQTKGITLMALPGNIIVELESSLDQKKAEVFFGQRGLRIVRKLEMVGRNFYEVETPAGAESLNIANSLYGQTGVISSMPNWWREVTAK